MADPKKSRSRKKSRKVDANGIAHIRASFNNTIITLTDQKGNTVAWASAGKMGLKGSKKSTPFAAQLAGAAVGKEAMDMGLRRIEVWVNGPGNGRESAIRSLSSVGLEVTSIRDVTPIPHNGCRPPKRRRV